MIIYNSDKTNQLYIPNGSQCPISFRVKVEQRFQMSSALCLYINGELFFEELLFHSNGRYYSTDEIEASVECLKDEIAKTIRNIKLWNLRENSKLKDRELVIHILDSGVIRICNIDNDDIEEG